MNIVIISNGPGLPEVVDEYGHSSSWIPNLVKDKDITAKETPPWLDFITQYTYPPLQIKYESDAYNIFYKCVLAYPNPTTNMFYTNCHLIP